MSALELPPTPAGFDVAHADGLSIDRLVALGSDKWTRYPGTIGAFIAEMDFGTAPVVADTITTAVNDGVLGYLPAWLETDLARALSDWELRHHGWAIDPARIRPLPDVLEALHLALRFFHRPGAPVVVMTPAYMPFLAMTEVLGHRVVESPMRETADGWEVDLADLDRALADGGTLVLCNPHNPIGKVYTRDELVAIAEVVERRGARVFSDEIHSPLVYRAARHVPYGSLPEAADHTITAMSASKAFNIPSLKCSQVILSEHDLERWTSVAHWFEHKTSTLGALASVTAFDEGEDWLAGVLDYLHGNLVLLADLLADAVPQIRMTVPDGTYIAWLDCRALELPADRIAEHFRAFGLALTDGADCGAAGEGFVRFNAALPRPYLDEVVRRMADAVAASPASAAEPLRAHH